MSDEPNIEYSITVNQSQTPRAMTKLLLSGAILTAIVWSGVLLRGCGTRVSTTFNVAAQPTSSTQTSPNYPKAFSITPLKNDAQLSFGLRPLQKPQNLRGSLVFMGSGNRLANRDVRSSLLLQRVDFNQKRINVSNFQLPSYQLDQINGKAFPFFRSTKNQLFFRLQWTGDDEGGCELYGINTTTKRGQSVAGNLHLAYNFLVSPSGRHYSYITDNFWSGNEQRWFINKDGVLYSPSQQPVQGDFTWSDNDQLVYSAFDKKQNFRKNYEYPNVYRRDSRGRERILKVGGYKALLSSNNRHLAVFVPDVDPKKPPKFRSQAYDDTTFTSSAPFPYKRVALAVYDLQTKQQHKIQSLKDDFPQLFWSKRGNQLFSIANTYIWNKKMALCYIRRYDVRSKTTKLLTMIKTKGEAANDIDTKLHPSVTPIKIVNDKYLLCYVPNISPKGLGGFNFTIFLIDLKSGKRTDIYSFLAPISYYGAKYIDWIDG